MVFGLLGRSPIKKYSTLEYTYSGGTSFDITSDFLYISPTIEKANIIGGGAAGGGGGGSEFFNISAANYAWASGGSGGGGGSGAWTQSSGVHSIDKTGRQYWIHIGAGGSGGAGGAGFESTGSDITALNGSNGHEGEQSWVKYLDPGPSWVTLWTGNGGNFGAGATAGNVTFGTWARAAGSLGLGGAAITNGVGGSNGVNGQTNSGSGNVGGATAAGGAGGNLLAPWSYGDGGAGGNFSVGSGKTEDGGTGSNGQNGYINIWYYYFF